MEAYAASRAQDGATTNEDAFTIARGPITWAAVSDGAGDARLVTE